MKLSARQSRALATDPSSYITKSVKKFVTSSPANRITEDGPEPLVTDPVIGFADGRDPIFREFTGKEIIGNHQLLPEQALSIYLERQHKEPVSSPPVAISVISVALIGSPQVRLSNQSGATLASRAWARSYGRVFGLMGETLDYIAAILEASGHRAVAPVRTRPMTMVNTPDGLPGTDWSEKHAAYAAGIGTFGLHTSVITRSGTALHFGSVITDLAIEPTPRPYDDYRAYCLFFNDTSCQACARHCPSGAVNTRSFEPRKCMEYSFQKLPDIGRRVFQDSPPDEHFMCALCQIGVPCEAGLPRVKTTRRRRKN